jgi:hypothetical protein
VGLSRYTSTCILVNFSNCSGRTVTKFLTTHMLYDSCFVDMLYKLSYFHNCFKTMPRAGSLGVQTAQWNWASLWYGPQKNKIIVQYTKCLVCDFLGGWFEVPHVCGGNFHLWVYRIYMTPCIYLLKNLNKNFSFKKNTFLFYYGSLFTYRTEPPNS